MFKKAAFPKHRKEEPLGTSQTPVGLDAQPQLQLANGR